MAFVRVNGIVLHYADQGRKDAPAIVFANSLGTDFRIWEKVADNLSADYRIILYDKRGHGLSDATPQPYRIDDHIEDLTALLKHLSVSNAVIVGLSVGGVIAQGIAARHPELARALVLCDTAHKIGNDEMWNGRISVINADGIAPLADMIMQRWFTPAYRTPENADYSGFVNMLTRTTVDGYAGTCAALRDADLTESTRTLNLPVLCIVGDQDGSTPPDLVRELASLIKGSRFEIIEGAGHIPCVEQPEATIALIRKFLDEVAPS
jgi:3-oxoadipate enol-lactonase